MITVKRKVQFGSTAKKARRPDTAEAEPPAIARGRIPDSVKIHEVLDNCHAVHHVSLALSALGISDADRNPLYRELRTRLRNGFF